MAITSWDVVVLGAANTDFIVQGHHLPRPGESLAGETFRALPGGTGANQAIAAARLGARVALVARAGTDDRGDEIVHRLAEERVDARYVVRDTDAATGEALVQVDRQGQKQILASPGANGHLSRSDILGAEPALSACRVLVASLAVPLEAVREAVRLAREAGAKVVLDPAPSPEAVGDLLGQVDLIKPNAFEAEALTGVRVVDRDSARRAAEALLDRGAGAAAVAAPGAGDLLLWRGGEAWLPHLPVATVDTTGAGDAFAAACAVALAWGWDLGQAGLLASGAAALATTGLGGQSALPTYAAVADLLRSRGLALPPAPGEAARRLP